MRIASLLLAAGAGRRFGGRKQLALIDDKPLVRCTLEALAAVFAEQPYIVLGAYRADIRPIVEDIAQVIDHPSWQKGLGSSIAYGVNTIEARQRYDGILISLADQFRLTPDDFNRLIERFDGDRIVAAHYANSIGVPAIFPSTVFEQLKQLDADHGAKTMLVKMQQEIVTVLMPMAKMDIDVVGDIGQC
jgi:molybdenum cofactor cytidylyltransferase